MTSPIDAALARLTVGVERERSEPAALEQEVAALFDELRSPLYRYLLSFRLPAHDSEEILQETFLALFRHLLAGRPRTNLRGWVFRVAHNLALKRHNAARVAERRLAASDEAAGDRESDPAPGPEEQLSARQRQQRLLAVVAALPERDQRCLRLRAEGLRYRDIAAMLGMSLGSVAASLARSLGRISRADRG